jgi:hypothetical protein
MFLGLHKLLSIFKWVDLLSEHLNFISCCGFGALKRRRASGFSKRHVTPLSFIGRPRNTSDSIMAFKNLFLPNDVRNLAQFISLECSLRCLRIKTCWLSLGIVDYRRLNLRLFAVSEVLTYASVIINYLVFIHFDNNIYVN